MSGDTWKGSKGSSLTFTTWADFDECVLGDSVALIGDYATARGTAKVLIDGNQVGTISEKKAAKANRVVVWQKRYEGHTTAHSVKVVVTSGRFDVDGVGYEYSWDYKGCGG